jgi:hypothetical protein
MLSAQRIVVHQHVASHFATCAHLALPLLLLIGALSARADDRAAILHPTGSVTVNDVPATRPIPILVGDQIVTGHGATATIISEGTQVAMSSDSTIVYTNRQVMVLRNSAVITTLNGMAARTGALTISPVSRGSASQFEITRGNFGTKVTAATGSVAVADATGSVQLEAGNSVIRDSASQSGSSGISTGSKIPEPKDPLEFSVLGNNKYCPPRRCKRPPESPTHHCHPAPPPAHGWDDQAHEGINGDHSDDGGGKNGGGNHGGDPDPDRDCRCREHDGFGFQP